MVDSMTAFFVLFSLFFLLFADDIVEVLNVRIDVGICRLTMCVKTL